MTHARVPPDVWRTHAARLAADLDSSIDSPDQRWIRAVRETPRHIFVPYFYERDVSTDPPGWRICTPHDPISTTDWLATVYSPTTLITELSRDIATGAPEALSCSIAPDHALRLFQALKITDGIRILEIGTGTGYLTALLAHRVGDEHVTAIELDPDLTARARDALDQIGCAPTLITSDGVAGAPEQAPFDRILATCTFDTVPAGWIEQTRPGALVLTHVQNLAGTGSPILLRRLDGPVFEGRFLVEPSCRLRRRTSVRFALSHRLLQPRRPVGSTHSTWTSVDPAELDSGTTFALIAQLHLPPGTVHAVRLTPNQVSTSHLTAPDGSWAEITHPHDHRGLHAVREAGPTLLVDALEDAWLAWNGLDRPEWPELGISARLNGSAVWHRGPSNGLSWRLNGGSRP